MFRKIVNNLLVKSGYEIINKQKLPTTKILGLKSLNINTIIDVGANRGQFLGDYVKRFPVAQFFCFEPLTKEINELKKNSKKFKNKIVIVNSALGNMEGKTNFYQHKHTASSSVLSTTEDCVVLYPETSDQTNIEVKITTIDKYFGNILNEKHKNILLKLAVQGFELEVLKGAQKTLNMISACLLEINFTKLYNNQASFNGIYELFNKAGFKYAGAMEQNFNDEGRLVFSDILFIRENL